MLKKLLAVCIGSGLMSSLRGEFTPLLTHCFRFCAWLVIIGRDMVQYLTYSRWLMLYVINPLVKNRHVHFTVFSDFQVLNAGNILRYFGCLWQNTS
jgi:hypothetical protein